MATRILTSWIFWWEIICLILIPYPMSEYYGIPFASVWYAIDWVGANATHSCYIPFIMFFDDIMFSLMFLRMYFLIMALTIFAPTNSDLFAKRVAHDKGFDPNFMFQVKANMLRYKYLSILLMTCISVLFFAYTVRVYERPYFFVI